jgi:hypothetical protein
MKNLTFFLLFTSFSLAWASPAEALQFIRKCGEVTKYKVTSHGNGSATVQVGLRKLARRRMCHTLTLKLPAFKKGAKQRIKVTQGYVTASFGNRLVTLRVRVKNGIAVFRMVGLSKTQVQLLLKHGKWVSGLVARATVMKSTISGTAGGGDFDVYLKSSVWMNWAQVQCADRDYPAAKSQGAVLTHAWCKKKFPSVMSK